jgi:hypothetical protein
MTSAAGYPDFQPYSSWRGSPLHSATITVNAGVTTTYGPWPINHYAGIRFQLSGGVNGAVVKVLGGDTSGTAGTHLLQQWVFRNQTDLEVLVPITTAWFEITVTAQAALQFQVFMEVQPTNTAITKPIYLGPDPIIATLDKVLAGGGTDLYYPTYLLPGPAMIWLYNPTAGASLDVSVRTYNSDLTLKDFIIRYQNWNLDLRESFEIPAEMWVCRVFNNDGVNRQYSLTVTMRGSLT